MIEARTLAKFLHSLVLKLSKPAKVLGVWTLCDLEHKSKSFLLKCVRNVQLYNCDSYAWHEEIAGMRNF